MKGSRYCYWSVCDGHYAGLMEKCVRTAREAGVFKEFHVLTDRPIDGCECYDAMECDKARGLFKLHYLKAGMSKLLFDYFVWIDAETVFKRNPVNVLESLGKSPLHVPLELNLSKLEEDRTWRGTSLFTLRDLFLQEGISNQVYLSSSAFWIIHREAIDAVYELAFGFWHKAKAAGMTLHVSAPLGYAMQILCAEPEAHLRSARADLWGSSADLPEEYDGVVASDRNGGQMPAMVRRRSSARQSEGVRQ